MTLYKRHNLITLIYSILSGTLLLLMLYTPRTNLEIKIIFLVPVLFFIIVGLINQSLALPKLKILLWGGLFILYGFIWSYYGLLNGNPGYLGYFRLFVLWGTLYLVLITGIKNEKSIVFLLNICLFALIPICLFNIMLFLNTIGVISSNFILETDMGANAGLHVGYFQLTSHNIGSLLFLVPFMISILLLDLSKYYGINTIILVLILSLALITSYLSGRRALWLVVFLTPFLVFGLMIILKQKKSSNIILRKVNFIIMLSIILLFISFLLLPNLEIWELDRFLTRITESISQGNARSTQAKALLRGFYESPIFGHGFGIGVYDSIRNNKSPWLYELSYLLILHNTGIVGLSIYLGLLATLLYKVLKISKANSLAKAYGIPLFVGLFSFLVANATNPYIFSFDFMFPIFIALAFVNIFGQPKNKDV